MYRFFAHLKNIKAILGFSLMLAVPVTSQAISCTPLLDNFFLRCTAGTCSGIFRARDVREDGACVRRTIVEPLQDAEVNFLAPLVANSAHDSKMTGFYHVMLRHEFYGHKPVTATELKDAMSQPVFPRTSVIKIEFIGNAIDVDALKQVWQKRQDEELWNYRIGRLLDYGSLVICLALLLFSVMKFRRCLIDGTPGKGRSLTIQGAIFALTLLTWNVIASWVLFVVLVPLVVCLIWCYELLYYLSNRLFAYKARKLHTGGAIEP